MQPVIADLPTSAGSRLARPCISCGAEQHQRLYRNQLARIAGLDLSYDVVECRTCGAVFADQVAEQRDYTNYYVHCSKYDSIGSVEQVAALDRRRAEFAVRFVQQATGSGPRVLDIGCGSGVLLAAFASAGWQELCGIDPAPNAAESALRLFGITGVRQGAVASVGEQFALHEFDLLCLTAVLEHLMDPVEILRSLASRMHPGAMLLVEVPALERFAIQSLEPFGEFSIEHVNFFSYHSLVNTARRAGFRPMASAFLTLAPTSSDSLYVLFTVGGGEPTAASAPQLVGDYIRLSDAALQPVIKRAIGALGPAGAVIWGAGSHSARLLPIIDRLGLGAGVVAVIDSNPNLQGRSFGRHVVIAPDGLAAIPAATVIVSSFRSSAPIAAGIKARFSNRVCELYAPRPAGWTGDPAGDSRGRT